MRLTKGEVCHRQHVIEDCRVGESEENHNLLSGDDRSVLHVRVAVRQLHPSRLHNARIAIRRCSTPRWVLVDVKTFRVALVLGLIAAFGLAMALSPSMRGELRRAADILANGDAAALRAYILSFVLWAPIVSALLMMLQSLAAPLPAFALAVVNGLAFGLLWGTLLTIGSATGAAALSFGIARLLGRNPVEALIGEKLLAQADRFFARWGTRAVLLARLVPLVSFDVVSYAAGLTRMRLRPFLVATMIGMAPATFAYTYLGARTPGRSPCIFVVGGIVAVGVGLAVVSRRLQPQPV